ncbi:MAG: NUDIX domain-containing protein [Defluviitaleaceae bacterium]|nr:NUDIX domain-containing protein [Defluviitaleaceae bacterium]MCL2276111.1 NUDIX domain-containing protein [Defluviitaleaceae bacterium]
MKNHFTATGIVFNPAGRVLMIKHKKLKVWLPPGGHIDENELPNHAVAREILEETGVRVQVISAANPALPVTEIELPLPMEILLEDIEGDGSHNHIDMIYLCKTEESAVDMQRAEVDDCSWFTPEEIERLDTFENVKNSVRKAAMIIT